MKKPLYIVGAVVIVALAAFFFLRRPSSLTTPNNQSSSDMMGEAMQFAKAVESGEPTVCTLTKDESSLQYFLKDGRVRADITSVSQDEDTGESSTTVSHMINDTVYVYTWSEDMSQGAKMKVPTEEEMKAMQDQAQDYQDSNPSFASEEDYQAYQSQGYTIDCRGTSVGDSEFTPPSNVEFRDLSAMMESVPSPNADGQMDMEELKKLQEQYGNTSQ